MTHWTEDVDYAMDEFAGVKGWEDEEGTIYVVTHSPYRAATWIQSYLDSLNVEDIHVDVNDLRLQFLRPSPGGWLENAHSSDLDATPVYVLR